MELKMTARQMEKQSQKVESLEKAERKKIVDVRNLKKNSIGIEQRIDGKRQNLC